jgi:hypothetical protein
MYCNFWYQMIKAASKYEPLDSRTMFSMEFVNLLETYLDLKAPSGTINFADGNVYVLSWGRHVTSQSGYFKQKAEE